MTTAPASVTPPREEIRRVLVVRLGAIGDMVVTLPALAALRKSLANASILLIANPVPASLVVGQGLVDFVTSYDEAVACGFSTDDSGDRASPGSAPPVGRPAPEAFDLAVFWVHEPSSMLVGGLRDVRFRQSITCEPPRLETETPPHAVDRFLASLSDALAPSANASARPAVNRWPRQPCLIPTEAERREAQAIWASLAPSAMEGTETAPIVIHPGSGSPKKNWPVERYAAVVDSLLDCGKTVALVGGPADEVVRQQLHHLLWSHRRCDRLIWLPAMPLTILAALLAQARVFLGNDSGITHVAAAVGAPTVAIFGPTDPAVWAPRGRFVRILRRRPTQSDSAVGHPPTAWVTVGEVLAALTEVQHNYNHFGHDPFAIDPSW